MNLLVIVETRCLPNIREIVANHVEFTGWDVMFFHGTENEYFIKAHLQGINVYYIRLLSHSLNSHEYNKLLTLKSFWECIPADKILIFQHDSRILRTGIEEFMEYDFIGAPIIHATLPMPCMNGGISLRSRDKMIEVIDDSRWTNSNMNEDIYMCRGIEKIGGILPTKEVASKFSVESIFCRGSMCTHAVEKWLTPDQCSEILNQYK